MEVCKSNSHLWHENVWHPLIQTVYFPLKVWTSCSKCDLWLPDWESASLRAKTIVLIMSEWSATIEVAPQTLAAAFSLCWSAADGKPDVHCFQLQHDSKLHQHGWEVLPAACRRNVAVKVKIRQSGCWKVSQNGSTYICLSTCSSSCLIQWK